LKTSLSIAIGLFAFASCLCEAAVEFSGYAQSAQESKFVLTDTEEAESSGWLAIGQSFKGYTLVAFDGKDEVLSVQKGNTTIKLPLKVSRVKTGSSDAPQIAQQLATAKEELAEMRKRYLGEHPRVKEQLKKIESLERQLAK